MTHHQMMKTDTVQTTQDHELVRHITSNPRAIMAIEDFSKIIPGPRINGKEAVTFILSTAQLSRSPLLPKSLKIINAAFRTSHDSKPELRMNSQGDRLRSTEEFLAALSGDPESFVLIITYPGTDDVVSTASCRRYLGPPTNRPGDRNTPWIRTLDVAPDTEEWELKLMATDVNAQGQGLAGYMMKAVEAEIKDRFRLKHSLASGSGASQPNKLKMVICTPLELTGDFYLRRGYTMDYQTWRGEDYNFHIVFMHKMIEHDSSTQ